MIDERIKVDPAYRAAIERESPDAWGAYRRSAVKIALLAESGPSGGTPELFGTGANPLTAYHALLHAEELELGPTAY